jgi:signal peptidase I
MTRRTVTLASGLLAVVGAIGRAVLFVVEVRGDSMRPTFQDGDRLLAIRRWASPPVRPGDVVIVRAPAASWRPEEPLSAATTVIVKRVVVPPADRGLPRGGFWVRGDAPDSYDSRRFGAIEQRALVGRAVWRLPSRASRPNRSR